MGTRAVPLPFQFKLLLGKVRDRWPPEARFIDAAQHGDVRDIKSRNARWGLIAWGISGDSFLIWEIAKELDVHGHGILVTVASTTYMGMNALHAAGGCGKLPAYQYLVEEVKMDINKPDTCQRHSFIHAFLVLNYRFMT